MQEEEEGIEDEALDTVDNSSHSENSQVKKWRGQITKICQNIEEEKRRAHLFAIDGVASIPIPIHLQFWQSQANCLPLSHL